MSTYEYKTQQYDRVTCDIDFKTREALLKLAKENHVSLSRFLIEAVEDVYNCDLHTHTR